MEFTSQGNKLLQFDSPPEGHLPAIIRKTTVWGATGNHTKVEFPAPAEVKVMSYNQIGNLSKIEYDIGITIRTVRLTLSNGMSSDKIGGNHLESSQNVNCRHVGKIEVQLIAGENQVGRFAFYDRGTGKLILEVRKNGELNPQKETTELAENEKMAGYDFYHNGTVLYGVGFRIARRKDSAGKDTD